jgi:DNA-binding protein YbaB
MFDLKKAMELKKQMEAMAAKLDAILVDGESGDGRHQVKVTLTANRDIKNIDISEALLASGDKEHLEDLLVLAFQRATDKAKNVAESESRAMAMGGGLSGLGL